MHVARTQLRSETVALAVEQQQRVIAGGLEVPVVGAVLLLPVHRDLCAVHVQHHALRRIDRFRPGNQLPVDRGQPGEILFLGQQLRLERLQAVRSGCPFSGKTSYWGTTTRSSQQRALRWGPLASLNRQGWKGPTG